MAGYERIRDRGSALGRQLGIECGRQLRVARVGSGLSRSAIATAARVSTALVSRVERGLVPGVTLPTLARLFTAVGLRLSVKAYPDGDAIRDAPQARVLTRFRALLRADAPWKTEVPIPIPGDRRAWDAWTRSGGREIGLEVETGLTDVQAVLRRFELKQRDGQMDRVVLVLADTRRNREAFAVAREAFRAACPIGSAALLRALRDDKDPGGNALIFV